MGYSLAVELYWYVCPSVCMLQYVCPSVCISQYVCPSDASVCISVCTIYLSVCVYVCMCLTTHTIYSTAQLHGNMYMLRAYVLHIISCNVSVVAAWLMMACYLINLYYHYYISGLQGEDTA